MANETLITDLVAQEALDQLAALDEAMAETLEHYKGIATEMAKGLKIPVEVQGDLEKVEKVYEQQMQRAGQATQQLTNIQQQQAQVIANTTNTISRQLAEQEKLNKAQREAYTEQQRGLDIAKNVLGTHDQNVALLARYNKEMKNLKDAYKNQAIGAEEYTRRELELKTAKQELQKILNNETKMMQAAEGSYQRLSLELERMKMAQKQLNEEQKNGAEGKALEKEIQTLDAHLKDMAADMGEFQRNVGNYAIAGKSLRTELKELTMQMAQMLADGVDPTSEAFLQVAERAGVLKDAMEDAKDTIKDYSNDTQGLTQGISVLQTAVGGWQALEGAMSAFGMESEDAAKATQKLMGIMSLMNGIQKISTELTTNGTGAYRAYHAILKLLGIEKAALTTATAAEATAMQAEAVAATETAVAEGAVAAGTEAATVASGAHTAAVGVETVALTGATAAATALKLALAALGIGAVIALIVALYEGIKEFNKEAEETAERLEALNKDIKDSGKAAAETAGEMKYYTSVVNDFNGSAKEEKQLVEELNSKYGESLGYYQSLAQWKKALTDISETYLDVLKWEAEAQVLLHRYAEAQVDGDLKVAEEYLRRYTELSNIIKSQRGVLQRQIQLNGGSTTKPGSSGSKSTRKGSTKKTGKADNGAADAEADMQELIKEASEMMDKFRETEIDRNIAMNAIITDAAIDTYNRQLDVVRSLYEEKEKLIIKDRDQAIAAEQEKYDKAIAEAKKYKKDTTELADAREQAVAAIVSEYQQTIEDNEKALNDTIANMAADRLALIEDNNEMEIASITASHAEKANILRELYIDEMRQAEGNEQKIAEIRRRYAKESAELAEQSAIEVAQASIKGLEDALAVEDMSDEDRERIAKELAKAKMDLAKAVSKAEENELERAIDAEQDARDKRMDAIQDWAQKVGQAISAVSDLFTAMYDGQISKIEEQMDAEEAHHEAQIAQIDELEEHGTITKEEAELRKREAEARTAKAQEALEKKKAQAEYKRAVAEKANSISQIGIATALGIMKASPNWVMMALVGAMGAIQIATALAQPIKAYKEGTKGKPHPGGLAVVGDGGKTELVVSGHNVWLTPDEPTLVDLPKGAQVFPEVTRETIERIGASLPMSIPRDKSSGQPVIINDYSALEDRVAANTSAVTRNLASLEKTITREMRRQRHDAYIKRRT